MPDIFKYLVHGGGGGGGGDKKACICIDLFPYTLCRKCIKLWLHLNLKKMLSFFYFFIFLLKTLISYITSAISVVSRSSSGCQFLNLTLYHCI